MNRKIAALLTTIIIVGLVTASTFIFGRDITIIGILIVIAILLLYIWLCELFNN